MAPTHGMSDSEAAAVTAQDDLHAPSPEEAPTAQVEEEEVAYDEEPDEEQQTDGPAPVNSAEAHSEDLQQVPVVYLCRQAELLETCAEYCAVIK